MDQAELLAHRAERYADCLEHAEAARRALEAEVVDALRAGISAADVIRFTGLTFQQVIDANRGGTGDSTWPLPVPDLFQ